MTEVRFNDTNRLACLRRFFSQENQASNLITIAECSIKSENSALAILIALFDKRRATALPFMAGETCRWLGIPGDTHGADALLGIINAFIVPSFGKDAEVVSLEKLQGVFNRHPSQSALPDRLVVWSSTPALFDITCLALTSGLRLLSRRPVLQRAQHRHVFEVLREFQESLMARDWDSAKTILGELSQKHLVSHLNTQFLRVQLLESMGEWEEIMALPCLYDLASIHLPFLVRRALLRAAYYFLHADLEGSGDMPESLEAFKENRGFYNNALRGVTPGDDWMINRLLAYRAVTSGDDELLQSVRDNTRKEDRHVLEEIARLITGEDTSPTVTPSLTVAQKCALMLIDGDYEGAFFTAQGIEDLDIRATLIIRIAFEGGKPSYIDQAQKIIEEFPPDKKSHLLGKPIIKSMVDALGLLEQQSDIEDWDDWTRSILTQDYDRDASCDRARQIRESWSPSGWSFEHMRSFSNNLREIIASSSCEGLEIVSDCYPFILGSFIDDPSFPEETLIDAYKALFETGISALACNARRAQFLLTLSSGICELDSTFSKTIETDFLNWLSTGKEVMNKQLAETQFLLIERMLGLGIDQNLLAKLWIESATFLSGMPSITASDHNISKWRSIGQCCGIPIKVIDEHYASDDTILRRLIDLGESDKLEFKSTARWDLRQNKINKTLEFVIIKTVAAFMNSVDKGTLLIGVDDDGSILGLEKDYDTLGKRRNRDGFENWITTLLLNSLGKEYSRFIHVYFFRMNGKDVCRVDALKSTKPVYVRRGNEEPFFIRAGNSTRELTTREALVYCSKEWPHIFLQF